jgi:AraC-like DNA-binding protein/tetratricopeptide (TPR) repeat protein
MNMPLSMDQVFINKLTGIVLANLSDEELGAEKLSKEAGMSRSNINRRLRSIKNQDISQFIREIRLNKAMAMLQNNEGTAAEIAFRVGFGSPTYFNKCFHDYYGYPPGEVRKKTSVSSEEEQSNGSTNLPGPHKQLLPKSRINQIRKTKRILFMSGSGILIISIALIIFFDLFNFFHKDKLKDTIGADGRISIAVMPFRNKTNDVNLDYMEEVIQDNLINVLSNYYSEGLIIRQTESISKLLQSGGITKYDSITPSVASTISQKLNANVFISGHLNKEGTTIRIYARLINSKTKDVFKSFQLEGNSDKIMPVIDSLSSQIRDFLLITILKKDNVEYQNLASTNSPEAYRYFILGKNARLELDYPASIDWFKLAVDIDSNFTLAIRLMCSSYGNQGLYKDAKKWIFKLCSKKDIMSVQEKIWADYIYAESFETPYEAIKYLKRLQKIDDQSPILYFNLGLQYQTLQQYDKAIPEYEKMLKIFDKWGSKPFSITYYGRLAGAYHDNGQNRKAKKILMKGEKDFPDTPSTTLDFRQAYISLAEGDTLKANRYIEKVIPKLKSRSFSEADIATYLAQDIYSNADFPDKAEEYYRKAKTLEPEDPVRMNNLGYFLIDKDRDINGGMELVDKALESSPDDYGSLHSKGWGLYKQGKYQEAKDILQKSWNLRMENAIYDHTAFLHLEEAKKAAEKQK